MFFENVKMQKVFSDVQVYHIQYTISIFCTYFFCDIVLIHCHIVLIVSIKWFQDVMKGLFLICRSL